jgi:hypothetical protein
MKALSVLAESTGEGVGGFLCLDTRDLQPPTPARGDFFFFLAQIIFFTHVAQFFARREDYRSDFLGERRQS